VQAEERHTVFHDNIVRKQFEMSDKIDALLEQAAIPKGDTPTVEELLQSAKSDPAQRKVLENTLAELEFSDPQIEFN
jgi:hypothetical protein